MTGLEKLLGIAASNPGKHFKDSYVSRCREALLELEEYETAQEAIQKAQSLGGPAKKCEQLLQKCRAELSGRNFGSHR